MADPSLIEDPELQKLNAQVLEDPEEFEHWEKLVRSAESQEGGLNRNSSPDAITSTREIYDQFLARFPLFFGYWKKYADLEFSIAGTEAAEMVYERGVASIGSSVDLWANYCGFKVDTSHDPDVIRVLFERGAESVGLDYLSHPFWDKYIEFEERLESQERVFAVLARTIRIPMHQYARYFERYRAMSPSRAITELATSEAFRRFQEEVEAENAQSTTGAPADIDAQLRARLDAANLEIFNQTHAETTKRWTYESEIKRPYFHVTELDDAQLANWRKYLDFEESEGDYIRTKFLYERCLVTAANYDEFWMRYARWMLTQPNKTEEVRNIYQRAACVYVPISRPTVRLWYAQFEESVGRADTAIAILEAILLNLPSNVEAIVSLANVYRRHHGLSVAADALKSYVENPDFSSPIRGALVSEWARLVWKSGGSAPDARAIFRQNQSRLSDSFDFWAKFLDFELEQPTSLADEPVNYKRIKSVYTSVRAEAALGPEALSALSNRYFQYLKERGGKDAMKEFVYIDVEINGPSALPASPMVDSKGGQQNGVGGGHAASASGNVTSGY